MNFELTSERREDAVILAIRGDLDLQTVEQARRELEAIEAEEPELLVVDLSSLSFMDSLGMGLIAGCHVHAIDAGRRFVVVRPPGQVGRPFELAGFSDVWDLVGSVEEALEQR
jgi:anti-sigma B factor antagonist